jgi:outer membrane protein insertion porin family
MVGPGRVALSLFFACCLAATSAAQAPAPSAPGAAPLPIPIRDVGVQGTRRVQESVILGRVTTKVGGTFTPARLAEDIRAIFGLGFFEDVQAKVEDFEGGVRVVFVVTERPFVRDVTFSGNKEVATGILQDKVDVKLGSVFNPADVSRSVEKIRDQYEDEGYFEVQIAPDTVRLPDGDVSVVFRVTEGRKITIDAIVIEGAKGLTPKQIKAVMATQERQYLIFRGTVQRQKLDEDLDRIVALYNDYGYIQARVDSSDIKVDRERGRATIRIVVVEGAQFRVGGIDVTGNTVLPSEEIRRRVRLRTGEPFSRSELRDSVRGIQDLYGVIGRANAEINPSLAQDAANLRISLTFEITEGPEVYVERINISGNTRSEDKILRREIPMHEGDLFTTAKLVRARQRITNLGYFEQVRATTAPGASKERVIVNIEVVERPTGAFSIGAGYSSQDAFVGTLDLSQRNFLGRGWEVYMRLRAGTEVLQGAVGFTEPWLFDRPLSFGFDLFSNQRDYDQYSVRSLGGDIRLSHPVGDFSRASLIYRVSQDEVFDVAADAGQALQDEAGTTLTNVIGLSLSRDTRDSALEPTRGNNSFVSFDLAGLVFGDAKFYRVIAATSFFFPAWRDHVLAFRIMGGYIDGYGGDTVPLFERFFLGGPNSIRSFEFRDISPADASGDLIGGNIELVANLEYIIPLWFGFRGVLFFDAGNVWGPAIPGAVTGATFDITQLKYAVGAGLRWNSPFGPLRVDYGINPARQAGESFGQFQFAVGSTF